MDEQMLVRENKIKQLNINRFNYVLILINTFLIFILIITLIMIYSIGIVPFIGKVKNNMNSVTDEISDVTSIKDDLMMKLNEIERLSDIVNQLAYYLCHRYNITKLC